MMRLEEFVQASTRNTAPPTEKFCLDYLAFAFKQKGRRLAPIPESCVNTCFSDFHRSVAEVLLLYLRRLEFHGCAFKPIPRSFIDAFAKKPAGRLPAASCLCGIGFTMALFIATLAFGEGTLLDMAKIGILAASLAAGVCGSAFLLRSRAPQVA